MCQINHNRFSTVDVTDTMSLSAVEEKADVILVGRLCIYKYPFLY